jgi:hypothetical protein
MHQPGTDTRTIHSAACDIWETPALSAPDALLDQGYRDETTIAYLSAISPIYHALSRILAQFSGLLLLSMSAGRSELSLDHSMHQTALDQLCEAGERLAPIKVPPMADRHYRALAEITAQLHRVARAWTGCSPNVERPRGRMPPMR